MSCETMSITDGLNLYYFQMKFRYIPKDTIPLLYALKKVFTEESSAVFL